MKIRPFDNHSIFDGIVEFDTDKGDAVMAVAVGDKWKIMILDETLDKEPRFRHRSTVKINGLVTPKKLWAAHKKEVKNVKSKRHASANKY